MDIVKSKLEKEIDHEGQLQSRSYSASKQEVELGVEVGEEFEDGIEIGKDEQEEKSQRKTGLFFPNMVITSHKGEVYSIDFSKDGKYIASCSFDMTVMVHHVYTECETIKMLQGHKNAVLQVKWTRDDSHLVSASADNNLLLWDVETGTRVKSFKGHSSVVNSVDVINNYNIVSCGDDGFVKFWDFRVKNTIHNIKHEFPLLAVHSEKSGKNIYTSCVDNTIKSYNYNTYKLNEEFCGHNDFITGLHMNNEETILASISSDENIFFWDIQPFPCDNKLLFRLKGPRYNIDYNLIKLRFNNENLLACGSGDSYVYIYDYKQKVLKNSLPGHQGTVNDVAFHPIEPIIASCSSDHTIFLGEL